MKNFEQFINESSEYDQLKNVTFSMFEPTSYMISKEDSEAADSLVKEVIEDAMEKLKVNDFRRIRFVNNQQSTI